MPIGNHLVFVCDIKQLMFFEMRSNNLQSKWKFINKTNWMKPDADTYVAMLEDLDSEVGRLLAVLDKHKLTDNTLVIFVSDNGGFSGAANMGPFSGAKSTTMEGGIRVPLILRWPGKIPAMGKSNEMVHEWTSTRRWPRSWAPSADRRRS